MKLKLDKDVKKEINKIFPNATILYFKPFENGLVHAIYKVKITNPDKIMVVRIYKLKRANQINANNQALSFLNKRGFPTPLVYLNTPLKNNGIILMEYIDGKQAEKVFLNSSKKIKIKITKNSGKLIKKLHNLVIPKFWIHHKHEIKNKKEWLRWIKIRINKYLTFSKENLDKQYYIFLKKELEELFVLLNYKMKFVPMHWDFHLGNILVNKKGDIKGIIDFDNILKGDSLAELGQIHHSLRFSTNNYTYFKYFLQGYKKKLSEKEERIIRGYSLLHNVAIIRSIWKKKKRLGWIIKKNLKIMREMMKRQGLF